MPLPGARPHVSKWKLDDGRVMDLVTAEQFAALPIGTMLTCVDGRNMLKGRDHFDDDTRLGYLAYGVVRVPAVPSVVPPPEKDVCPFCKAGRDKHKVEGDDACRWIRCNGCGAQGPTVTIIGCLNRDDQKRRAREKFYAPNRGALAQQEEKP